jgi:hypothetical protein
MMRKYFIVVLWLFVVQGGYGQHSPPLMTVNEYIDRYKDIAIKKMREHRIPASVTLAQGILESANGNSRLAVEANNHFGIKCHENWAGETFTMDDDAKNECFRKYKSAEQSFEDHSMFLMTRSRYSSLFTLDESDYKGWAAGLKKAGYATNPDYTKLLIKIIDENRLYEYDQKGALPFSNRNTFDVQKLPIAYKKMASKDDNEVLNFGRYARKILKNNRIKYTIARRGDNVEKLANDLEMMPWQIARYNEISKGDQLTDGQIVYIQPKRRRGSIEFHIVKEGETMYTISQLYGVKTKFLYRKNSMAPGSEPSVGQKLSLRSKVKPEL